MIIIAPRYVCAVTLLLLLTGAVRPVCGGDDTRKPIDVSEIDDDKYEGKTWTPPPTFSNQGYILRIPRISEVEFQEFARVLELDDSQLHIVEEHFQVLLSKYYAQEAVAWASIEEEAARVGDIMRRGEYLPEEVRFVEIFYRKQRDANEATVVLEQQFFEAVGDVISESQQLHLAHVIEMRDRTRYVLGQVRISGAQLDLIDLISRLEIDANECHPFLQKYERDLGQLRQKHYLETLSRRVELVRFRASRSMDDPGSLQDRARILRELVRIEMRLRAINVIVLEQLRTCLTREQAGVLIEVARSIMYPTLFPDGIAEEAFGEAANIRDSYAPGSAEHEAFQSLIENALIRYEAVVSVLVEAVVSDQELLQSTLFGFVGEREAHELEVAELLAKRKAVCDELIAEVDRLKADIANMRSSHGEEAQ